MNATHLIFLFFNAGGVTPVPAGTTYPFFLQTAPSDFSDIDKRFMGFKVFRYLHLEYVPTGAPFDVAVEIEIDGKSKGTVIFSVAAAGSVLPFTLPSVLGGANLRRLTRTIVGEGHFFSLKILETGPNNPRLARAFAEFDMTGVSR